MRPLRLDEYQESLRVSAEGYPFYALIAAAMRQADDENSERLRVAFPDIWASLRRRYKAPLGVVPEYDGMTAQEYAKRQEMQ